jgi:hypothetical protein
MLVYVAIGVNGEHGYTPVKTEAGPVPPWPVANVLRPGQAAAGFDQPVPTVTTREWVAVDSQAATVRANELRKALDWLRATGTRLLQHGWLRPGLA